MRLDLEPGAAHVLGVDHAEPARESRQRIGLRVGACRDRQRGCAFPVSALERVTRRHCRSRREIANAGRSIAAQLRGQRLLDHRRGFRVLRQLQVRVHREVSSVVIVRLNLEGREVRRDRILPEPDHRVDVSRHVACVRHRRRECTVSARGRNAALGKWREVVGVNQIVRDAGMLRVGSVELLEHRGRRRLIGIRQVALRRRGLQREGVVDLRFEVLGIAPGDLLHGGVVVPQPNLDRCLVEVPEVGARRVEPVALAVRLDRHRAGLLERFPGGLGCGRRRRRRQRVAEEVERHTPIGDGARRILGEHVAEGLARVVEPVRVQHRDAAVELVLHGGGARCRKGDRSELIVVLPGGRRE